MKYILITFSNRTALHNFTQLLKLKGISFVVINTPRAISISCGLSVKISSAFYNKVTELAKRSS